MPFEPGCDPRRYLRAHRERGAVRYAFSMSDIAAAAGVSVHTARQSKALRNALASNDLLAMALWIVRKAGERKRV